MKLLSFAKTAAALLAIVVSAQARAGESFSIFDQPLSERVVSYDIGVRLDPDARMLHGSETVTWRNTTDSAAGELRFHMYLNAFRNTRSTWIRERGPKHLAKELKKDGWGFIEITGMRIGDGPGLMSSLEYIAPDDGNTSDRTLLRAPLPESVPPGGSVTVSVDFIARLPSPPVARTGSKKEFFFVAQWFPKLGVFENGGWNCHQFHANSEFYADFGVYDVRMTVPSENVVGASGLLVERNENGDGTATHYYRAEDVHDFAWTTSPNFVEHETREQDVDIRVLMHREHEGQAERHLEAARLAVRYFQDWYGDYPYPNLTVVDPRKGASGAGGMEYPTLITAGTFTGMPKKARAVEMVIIHEFGHNYWYGMVATDEAEEAWLDEGINTYSEIKIMHDLYGDEASMIDFPGLKVDDLSIRRYSYQRNASRDPMVRNSWDYYSRGSYGGNAYSKGALMMLTLEGIVGEDTVREILRTWLERYRFKHPDTSDFIAVANEVSGQDLSWFLDQVLFEKTVLDYSVSLAETGKLKPGKGYDFTISAPGGERIRPSEPGDVYESVVRVRRLGDFHMPVDIEVEFAGGEIVEERWDGRDAWVEYRYFGSSRLVRAEVDPAGKLPLDLNWKNNEVRLKWGKNYSDAAGGGYLDMLKFALDPD